MKKGVVRGCLIILRALQVGKRRSALGHLGSLAVVLPQVLDRAWRITLEETEVWVGTVLGTFLDVDCPLGL